MRNWTRAFITQPPTTSLKWLIEIKTVTAPTRKGALLRCLWNIESIGLQLNRGSLVEWPPTRPLVWVLEHSILTLVSEERNSTSTTNCPHHPAVASAFKIKPGNTFSQRAPGTQCSGGWRVPSEPGDFSAKSDGSGWSSTLPRKGWKVLCWEKRFPRNKILTSGKRGKSPNKISVPSHHEMKSINQSTLKCVINTKWAFWFLALAYEHMASDINIREDRRQYVWDENQQTNKSNLEEMKAMQEANWNFQIIINVFKDMKRYSIHSLHFVFSLIQEIFKNWIFFFRFVFN